MRVAAARLGRHVDPAVLAGALRDGIAHDHLVMAVLEGGVERVGWRAAGEDGAVDLAEVRVEGVAEAFDVAARQRGRGDAASRS